MSAALFRLWVIFLFGSVLFGCAGNDGELAMAGGQDIEMQGVCVGRYVMDIPAQWRRQQRGIESGGDATFYFGHDEDFTKVDVSVADGRKGSEFESAVLARESWLREKKNFSTDGPMLLSREDIGPGAVLLSSYASVDSTDAVRLEVHALLDESHVALGETAYSVQTRAGVQARLASMLSSIRSRGENDPSDGTSGFCIGGVILDPGSDYEESGIAYAGRLEGVPVKLLIDINTFDQASDEPGLIERGEKNLEGFGIRPKKLRSGSRQLSGDAGEEWLGTFVEDGQHLHGFYAETSIRKPTREKPKLLLSFLTGDEDSSATAGGIDDDSAVALWDKILGSIRKRSE